MSRRLLVAVALGAATLGILPAAPASARPCSALCTVSNALAMCYYVYDPVNEVAHLICPDDLLPV